MRFILAAAALAVVAACTPAHSPSTPATTPSVRQVESETVALVGTDRHGDQRAYCSGVWVGPGAIITANHCVDGVEDGERLLYATRDDVVVARGGEVEAVRFGVLVARDEAHDLALIRTRLAPVHEVAPLGTTVVGQSVQTEGMPLGLWFSYSTGTVAGIRELAFDEDGTLDARWYVQSTAPVSPGNSGGDCSTKTAPS